MRPILKNSFRTAPDLTDIKITPITLHLRNVIGVIGTMDLQTAFYTGYTLFSVSAFAASILVF